MRFLSVCSGIEAASVAWTPLGWEAVAFSEIEAFPSAVLAHHYPEVPNLGDMTTMDVEPLGDIDILVGGTPCQAFSVAGLRQSLDDARGNLTLSYVRLIHELVEEHNLRNAVWENVPGVHSTKDNAFGCFLGALVGSDEPLIPSPKPADGKSDAHWKWSKGKHTLKWPNSGMVSGPKGRAAWTIKDAQYFGLAQRRRRVFVVSDFGNGADPAAVLFERESVPGNPAPRRESRKDIAPTISARPTGGGGLGTDFDGGLIEASVLRSISDYGAGMPVLRAKGGDAGGGSEVLLTQGYGGGRTSGPVDVAAALAAHGVRMDFEVETFIATSVTGEISHTLKAEGFDASEDGTGRGNPIVSVHENQRAEISLNDTAGSLKVGGGKPGQGYPAAWVGSAVRRLTPVECERLQGFPDDYTHIPMPKKGKKVGPVWAADGPRYKALGNSMAVPVMRWIGERIERFMPREEVVEEQPATRRFNFGRLV